MAELPALILSLDWSDGTTTWQDGVNGPTEEMLDNTPDEKGSQDFLRPIEPYSKKEISWLCKMAGWLVESKDPEMYRQYKNKKICLKSLPENYRLYEHVKLPGPVSAPLLSPIHICFVPQLICDSRAPTGNLELTPTCMAIPKVLANATGPPLISNPTLSGWQQISTRIPKIADAVSAAAGPFLILPSHQTPPHPRETFQLSSPQGRSPSQL